MPKSPKVNRHRCKYFSQHHKTCAYPLNLRRRRNRSIWLWWTLDVRGLGPRGEFAGVVSKDVPNNAVENSTRTLKHNWYYLRQFSLFVPPRLRHYDSPWTGRKGHNVQKALFSISLKIISEFVLMSNRAAAQAVGSRRWAVGEGVRA